MIEDRTGEMYSEDHGNPYPDMIEDRTGEMYSEEQSVLQVSPSVV